MNSAATTIGLCFLITMSGCTWFKTAPPPAEQKDGTLEGIVMQYVNGVYSPAANAKVQILSAPEWERKAAGGGVYSVDAVAKTDQSGWFSFSRLPLDKELLCDVVGNQHGMKTITLRAGEAHDLLIFKLKGIADITGIILNEHNEPIEGAIIRRQPGSMYRRYLGDIPDDNPKLITTSSLAGRFTFKSVEADETHEFHASAKGYSDQTIEGVKTGEAAADFKIIMKRGFSISGNVFDGETGQPLAGVEMRIVGAGRDTLVTGQSNKPKQDGQLSLISNEEGAFRFSDLTPGVYHILGSLNRTLGQRVEGINRQVLIVEPVFNIEINHERPVENIMLKTWPAIKFEGQVTIGIGDQKIGVEKANVSYKLLDDGNNPLTLGSYDMLPIYLRRTVENYIQSSQDGKFAINGLARGKYQFEIWKDDRGISNGSMGYAGTRWPLVKTIDLSSGIDIQNYELSYPPGGSLSGVLRTATEAPVPGARVYVIPRKPYYSNASDISIPLLTTGNNGEFVVHGLFLGQAYYVSVIDNGSLQELESADFLLTENKPTAEMALFLEPTGTVTGRVVDEKGEPVEWAKVSLHGKYSTGVAKASNPAFTNNQGEFILTVAADEYYLQVEKEKYAVVQSEKFDVSIGQEEGGFEFVLPNEVKEVVNVLRGRLVDLAGNPSNDWVVQLRTRKIGQMSHPQDVGPIRVANDGSFQFHFSDAECQLILYNYVTHFETDWFSFDDEKSASGNEELIFRIPVAPGIRGRVVDARTGEPLAAYKLKYEFTGGNSKPVAKSGVIECLPLHYGQKPIFYLKEEHIQPDGSFNIPIIAEGNYTLEVSGEQMLTMKVEGVKADLDQEIDVGDIAVKRSPVIVCRLIDRDTGQPYVPRGWWAGPGASVVDSVIGRCISEFSQKVPSKSSYDKRTGILTISDTFWNVRSIRITGGHFMPLEVAVSELSTGGETNLGDIIVDPGNRLKARIVSEETGEAFDLHPNGSQILNIHIYIFYGEGQVKESSSQFTTMDEGRFELRKLSKDTSRVMIYFPNEMPLDLSDFVFGDERELDLGDVQLRKGAVIKGRILSPDGTPVSKAGVTVTSLDHFHPSTQPGKLGSAYRVAVGADEAGEFIVSHLFPGRAKITASVSSYYYDWVAGDNASLEKIVTVSENESLVLEFHF